MRVRPFFWYELVSADDGADAASPWEYASYVHDCNFLD